MRMAALHIGIAGFIARIGRLRRAVLVRVGDVTMIVDTDVGFRRRTGRGRERARHGRGLHRNGEGEKAREEHAKSAFHAAIVAYGTAFTPGLRVAFAPRAQNHEL